MSEARIVVVEDESIVAMEIEDRLYSLGYQVLGTYASGEEALKQIDKLQPDLILMDIMLHGELDGIETAEKIRNQYNIPSVYLTANSDENTLQRAKITEPYGYLLKPFEERELHTTVEMALYKSKMERKLIEHKKWLSTTLKSIGDAIIATDKNGRIKFMNSVAEKLTGWKEEDAIGLDSSRVFQIVNELTKEAMENPVQKALSKRETIALANHTVLISRNGAKRSIEDSAAPIINDKGDVLGVVLDFRDVSERKKNEKILHNSEMKFKSIFQASNDGIIITDASEKINSCNEAALKIFGYTEEELLDKPISFLMPALRNLIHKNKPKSEDSFKHIDLIGKMLEIEGLKKGETDFPIEVSITSRRTDEGNFLSFTIRDITERKNAELELKKERDFISAVLDTDGVLVIVLDNFGNLVRANRTWKEVTGYDLTKHKNEKFELLLRSDEEMKQFKIIMDKIYNTGKSGKHEVALTTKEGDSRQILWSYASIYNAKGEIDYIVGTGLDVTDLRKVEQQLRQAQKMDAIGKLAGGIAHDFNNLLTAINGYSDLILESMDTTNEFFEDIKEIRKAGYRAADLTHQLLAFSRRQMLDMKIINLNEVLQNMDKMLRRIIGENINLNYILSEDLFPIKTDISQIDQIILNLAVNARDAMPDGGRLTIETANVRLDKNYSNKHFAMKPGEYVMLAISDTGIGMTKEVEERLFEPFFTTKDVGKGTGLGLSTVYGIVKQFNGFIWVYTEPGEGTTFKIYLPKVEVKTKPADGMDEFQAIHYGSETILLVEDEKFVRDFVAQTLTKNGYTIIKAASAKEAIKIAEEADNTIDMLLTDVIMPDMSGKELEDYLRSTGKHLKTLFMSGYTDQAIVHHGILNENIEFMQKPFSPATLLRKVRKVLDGAQPIPSEKPVHELSFDQQEA
ncbi:blue-light-activated protein [bacterium BMS3Bbin03]|nr:blue-light-activated protein [bacterium BMS3Bbin03]